MPTSSAEEEELTFSCYRQPLTFRPPPPPPLPPLILPPPLTLSHRILIDVPVVVEFSAVVCEHADKPIKRMVVVVVRRRSRRRRLLTLYPSAVMSSHPWSHPRPIFILCCLRPIVVVVVVVAPLMWVGLLVTRLDLFLKVN